MWQDHLSHRAAAVPDISSTSPRLWANNSPLAKEVKKKPNYWMWEYATRFVIQVVKSQHTAFNEQVWTLTDFEPTSSTEVANDWSWCRLGQKEGSERVVLSISRKYSSDSIILILNSSGGFFLFCFFKILWIQRLNKQKDLGSQHFLLAIQNRFVVVSFTANLKAKIWAVLWQSSKKATFIGSVWHLYYIIPFWNKHDYIYIIYRGDGWA